MASIISAGTTSATALNMSADTSGVLQLASNNGTVAVTVDTSQNVGIGTTTPSTGTLNKQLTINSGASALAGVVLQNNTTGTGSTDGTVFYINSADAALINYEAGNLQFGTSATERARILSSGEFLVGLTTVPSTGSANGTAINAAYSGDFSSMICAETTTSSSYRIVFLNANGLCGSITTTGSATNFNVSSDYRLKENVQPMQNALSRILQLKPVTYKWKVDGSDGEGFIAHQLAEVCPQAVHGEKDAVNEDGSIKPQGIDTSFLVATLTAAIQEQQALITQLQTDVAALKAGA